MAHVIEIEKTIEQQQNVRSLVRFVRNLDLLRQTFIPSFLFIIVCAVIPQYFLWITGQLVQCFQDGDLACDLTHRLWNWELTIPLGIAFLVAVALLALVARIISWGLFELSGKWSAQKIHHRMMNSLAGARTTFFDENPSGRLINRIVGDYFKMEWAIIELGDSLNGICELLCVGGLIFIAHPVPALFTIPLAMAYFMLQLQWTPMLSHGRELQSIAFGEVLHRETDLIEGRDVFSLYGKTGSLLRRLRRAYDRTIDVGLLVARIQWWGELWMALLTISFSLVIYSFLVVGIHRETISPVLAAVIITAILNLSDLFGFLTWSLSHLGEAAANVRRILQFVDLPGEVEEERTSQRGVCDGSLDRDAIGGDIVFNQYSMSYRKEGPMVLKGLDLVLPQGKKIGIVGRTGAGKTSLFQSLFRMVHVRGGDIRIGDVSIYDVDIVCLRSLFGVVPQDPYLFSGTIRFNLGGGSHGFGDDKLIQALQKVQLNVDLGARVAEGGKDYSVGERQLLCLARVLIAEKPFILMDEPTSAVDMLTDAKIQQVLDTHMANRTLITIAHRLDSLKRYDLLIELQAGRFLRQGRPAELIPQILAEGGYNNHNRQR